MRKIRTWCLEQWMVKEFRIWTVFLMLITVVMRVEFYLFQYGWLKCLRYLTLFWFLGGIAWIDQRNRRIPNRVLQLLILTRTMILILECLCYSKYWKSIVIQSVFGAVLSGGMFLLCYAVVKGGIGAGDVKLLAVLGYCLGTRAIFTAIFLTVLLSALFSGGALLLKKTVLKQEIPFAPFVMAGTVITIMLGI